MWNKQRKYEVLIDVEDVALGHETRMRWNEHSEWIWSPQVVHEPLISASTFDQSQRLLSAGAIASPTASRAAVTATTC